MTPYEQTIVELFEKEKRINIQVVLLETTIQSEQSLRVHLCNLNKKGFNFRIKWGEVIDAR